MQSSGEEKYSTDELTGCLDYRSIVRFLERELDKSRQQGRSLSFAMVDIDGIRMVLNTYGSTAMDSVLKKFVSTAAKKMGRRGMIGRYGGDEFLLVFPGRDAAFAERVIESIRDKLLRTGIPVGDIKLKERINVHFSAGLVSYPYNGEEMRELLYSAEDALYRAKLAGRNCTVVERRRWARIKPAEPLQVEVCVLSSGKIIEARKIINVSRRGMLILLPEDVPFGNFLLRIRLIRDNIVVETYSRLMHKSVLSDGSCQAGMFVENIPEDIQKRLIKFP